MFTVLIHVIFVAQSEHHRTLQSLEAASFAKNGSGPDSDEDHVARVKSMCSNLPPVPFQPGAT